MRRIFYILFFLFPVQTLQAQNKVSVQFENFADGKRIVLNDSSYKNNFGEKYSVSKLKYYISNIHLITDKDDTAVPNVFLIDASKNNEILIPQLPGRVKGIEFLLGVDSMLNCSGAQSGALDPLNDMFWTWNNGYVMFKLEGNGEASNLDNHRIEQHIGGFKGPYKTMRKVFLPLGSVLNYSIECIIIRLDLDNYWNGQTKIRISEMPLIASMGNTASQVANNFPGLFTTRFIALK